jgi:hypothetical protein
MRKIKKQIELEFIDWFSAKGLKNIFIADHVIFGGKRKYTMDLWTTKDGRLLMRFHHKSEEAYNYAYEIKGMQFSDIPQDQIPSDKFPPRWLPDVINKAFDNWMTSEMPFRVSREDLLHSNPDDMVNPPYKGYHIRVSFGRTDADNSQAERTP